MPDTERLERAWKLHQRAQSDRGAEAEAARSLRDKILNEEDVTVARLEEMFNQDTYVPPFGRPSSGPRPDSTWSTFNAFADMNDMAERVRRATQEARRQQAERQRAAYRRYIPDGMLPLVEELIRIYQSGDADKAGLHKLLKTAGELGTCQAQLEAQAQKLDNGELSSPQALQQALRALLRSGRKQTEALTTLIGMMAIYVGSQRIQRDAKAFRDHFGQIP